MRSIEAERNSDRVQVLLVLLVGSLLALGVVLVVLLAGAIAVSMGVIRADASSQIAAAACLIGNFTGSMLVSNRWKRRRFFCGLILGVLCFFLIGLLSFLGEGVRIGPQMLAEFACCVIGGGLAGILKAGRKKNKRKVR